MGRLIEFKTDSGIVLIESATGEKPGRTTRALGVEKKIGKKLSDLIEVIQPMTETIIESIDRLDKKPDSISAEFGLSISGEGNIFVVKAAGEASLRVTFTWGKS